MLVHINILPFNIRPFSFKALSFKKDFRLQIKCRKKLRIFFLRDPTIFLSHPVCTRELGSEGDNDDEKTDSDKNIYCY